MELRNKEGYTGIDLFRVAAALLVVAIHTSPLTSVNDTADFVFTRAVARVGVPFFFMISGFALFSARPFGHVALRRFVSRTLKLYAVSILIYLPLNVYTGLFRERPLVSVLLKDLVFDGTVYHLWYFPAAIIGACIVWLLYSKAGFKTALAVTGILYVIGLLGDSYYGFAEQVPFLKTAYGYGFGAFDYTRNGLFFTPLFMLLGGMVGDKKGSVLFCLATDGNGRRVPRQNRTVPFLSPLSLDVIGFIVFFALMIAEALILHRLGVQRHDSMYVMLAPCMYFLFSLLTHARGLRLPRCRAFSMIVYVIHPMIIAAVLPVARVTGLSGILVDNSVVHYVVVCVGSVVFAWIWMVIWNRLKNIWKNGEKRRNARG
jgi:serine/alanine racemase